MLNHFFGNKNAFYRGADPPLERERRIHFRVLRRWQLQVWQLTGPPEAWEAQLHERFKSDPVLAVISGMGARTWEPVHRFCESVSLPCLLPNVDLPVVDEQDFYPVYFSRGVLLEADIIAHRIAGQTGTLGRRRIVQVFRPDDIGAAASKELAAALVPQGATVSMYELKSRQPAHELVAAARAAAGTDTLVFVVAAGGSQSLARGRDPGSAGFCLRADGRPGERAAAARLARRHAYAATASLPRAATWSALSVRRASGW
jgi:hypothetical protein